MFTGIISHIGTVHRIDRQGDWRMTIAMDDFTAGLAIGASVACSGVCLTVTEKTDSGFTVQVSQETLRCTTLGSWQEGTRVNLERALRAGDELGGHIVSGHVDGLATLASRDNDADSWVLGFTVPPALSGFIAAKGSVTLDGVSLTVNRVEGNRFWVNLIPHTQTATTFADRQVGDAVNCEIDMLARYLRRFAEVLENKHYSHFT